MKQSLATGKFLTLCSVLFFASISWLTACSRLPRSHTSDGRVRSPTSATKPVPINLNTASASELEKLPGVGPVLAERIISYRNDHGRFRRVAHLMMVRGISDGKFRGLRPLVKVE